MAKCPANDGSAGPSLNGDRPRPSRGRKRPHCSLRREDAALLGTFCLQVSSASTMADDGMRREMLESLYLQLGVRHASDLTRSPLWNTT